MIRFKQFLIEDTVQWLKDNTEHIDTSHDTLATHKDKNAIIDHLSTGDPTPKKRYTQWIVQQYQNGHIRQEDTPRVHETLTDFDKYKGGLSQEHRDIFNHKHIADLETVLQPYTRKGIISKKEQKRQIKDDGAELIHDHPDLKVYKLKTHEAACQYGAGTKWCTAGKNSSLFNQYSNQGPLYTHPS